MNGCVSLEQVRARDAVFAEHVELGLTWRVIPREPMPSRVCFNSCRRHRMRPSRSPKVKSNSFAASSLLQGAMHRRTSRAFARWPCLRSRLAASAFLHSTASPCDSAGEPRGVSFGETETFIRSSGQTRALGLGFWEVLSQDFKRGLEQIPHFRHGLLKVALTIGFSFSPNSLPSLGAIPQPQHPKL